MPINLRQFIVEQLGSAAEPGDETLLSLAAHADDQTLHKLARAIRRYSTARAHEAWAECAVDLASFCERDKTGSDQVALCLTCLNVEFGESAAGSHKLPGCVVVNLSGACASTHRACSTDHAQTALADALQGKIEEFRALRVAFGLPHFELDCYIRKHHLIFTWRPLP